MISSERARTIAKEAILSGSALQLVLDDLEVLILERANRGYKFLYLKNKHEVIPSHLFGKVQDLLEKEPYLYTFEHPVGKNIELFIHWS